MGRANPTGKSFEIPKRLVYEAWKKVRANSGAPGVDAVSISTFASREGDLLYKLWNRMSAGSYMPAPVRAVEIPKDHGTGVRVLGVPTVADRVAQTAAAMLLEEKLEPIFHPDSYGYRPGRSAHDALAVTRRRCWKQAWVLDLDIRAFFDNVPHDLLLKAVAHHTRERWVLLYIERWLKAPMQMPDGTLVAREKGTPQGSPISPLLANLFMTYAFDMWMTREHPGAPFERYADDCVPRTLKEDRCRRRYRRKRCCTRDGGRPSAVALQGEIANHREVRRSRAGVLSVAEKACCQRVRCGSRRRAKAIPPLKCRKRIGDIQNRGRVIAPGSAWREPADWRGGCPAWMVARAWSGLLCGTREPVAPMGRPGQWSGLGLRLVVWSENPKQQICEGESSDAGHRGGPDRSSDEGSVMGLERRERVVLAGCQANRGDAGGAG